MKKVYIFGTKKLLNKVENRGIGGFNSSFMKLKKKIQNNAKKKLLQKNVAVKIIIFFK